MAERNKKVGLAIFGVLYLAGSLFCTAYASALFFYIAIKTIPPALDHWTIVQLWNDHYGITDKSRTVELATLWGVLVGFGFPVFAVAASMRRSHKLHGDARFATEREIRKAGMFAEEGILLGKFAGKYLVLAKTLFASLAAPTRSGKGVAVVIPNLLTFRGSVLVNDIKCELFRMTSRYRALHGQEVYLWAPFAENLRTHRWNPLGYVREGYQRVTDLIGIGELLWPSSGTDQKEKFFNDQARNLFVGLALYLCETPSLPRTMSELLRQSAGTGDGVQDHLKGIMKQRAESANPLSRDCVDALNRFVGNSDTTLSSIVATFNAPLGLFASPQMAAATAENDFDLRQVRRRPMSIYVHIEPNKLGQALRVLNLFFAQVVNLNTTTLPQDDRTIKYECLIVHDEAMSMGRIDVLVDAVAYLAGYWIRLLTVFQSKSQVAAKLGKDDAANYLTNHAAQIIFAPREMADAKDASEMLGTYSPTILNRSWNRGGRRGGSDSESQQKRQLLLPQEVREIGEWNAIINAERCRPILAEKICWYAEPLFMDRMREASAYLRGLKVKSFTEAHIQHAVELGELYIEVPKLDMDEFTARREMLVREATGADFAAGLDVSLLTAGLNDIEIDPKVEALDPDAVRELAQAFFDRLGPSGTTNPDGSSFAITDEQLADLEREAAATADPPGGSNNLHPKFDVSVLDD